MFGKINWQRHLVLAASVVVVISTLVGNLGCTKAKEVAPPSIQYEIDQSAQLQKVSWYIWNEGLLGIEVTIKNVSGSERGFLVGASVNDGPPSFDDDSAAKKVKPNETLMVRIMQGTKSTQPQNLSISVKPQ